MARLREDSESKFSLESKLGENLIRKLFLGKLKLFPFFFRHEWNGSPFILCFSCSPKTK